jgi:hypothetical protein
MAAERYLLDELGPDARDEFEDHLFDCPECAMDLRAGVVFIDEAKRQLPKLAAAKDARPEAVVKPEKVRRDWFGWLKPVYMAPVMAALLIVVGYQNLVVLPGLEMAANQPSLAPSTPLHGATRGGDDHQKVTATAERGVSIPDVLPADRTGYVSFVVELVNPQGKTAWSKTVAIAQADETGHDFGQQTLTIPGRILENGTYTVKVIGVDAQGGRTQVATYVFDLTVSK